MTTNKYNPAYDNKIYKKYAIKTIEGKWDNKESFYNELGKKADKKVALFCITYSLVDENNIQMIEEIIDGLMSQKAHIALTGIGSEKYQKYFTNLANQYPDRIFIVNNDEESRRKVYAASDVFISSAKTVDCTQEAKVAMKYGCVPIIGSEDFVENYNPNAERGNGFTYEYKNKWSLFAAIIRALESFRFPFDWKNIQKKTMEIEL